MDGAAQDRRGGLARGSPGRGGIPDARGMTFPRGETATSVPEGSSFSERHIGPSPSAVGEMLSAVGYETLEALVSDTVPASIRNDELPGLGPGETEAALLRRVWSI